MSSEAITKLRRKFVAIAMLSFFVVILFTGGMAALSNEQSLRMEAERVLDLIVQNNGMLPTPTSDSNAAANTESPTASSSQLHATDIFEGFSPEFTQGARYFSVVFNKNGSVERVDVEHIVSVSSEEAVSYARDALESYDKSLAVSLLGMGAVDTFYYKVGHASGDESHAIVAFLDCSFQMQVNRQVGRNTIVVCSVGLLGSFVLVLLLSKRAIRPEIESARRQKQFITNASHELKTPLSVIRANTEVIEMLDGESEWTRSTMSQVDRMDGLVQNLVMIARAREREDRTSMSEIDVSKVIADSVDPFRALAHQEHKDLVCNIDGEVRMVADASAIQQLCTLLVDNAFKYCDDGGRVVVELLQPNRGRVTLVVQNTYANGKRVQFSRFFERFYRDDEAHSDEGGYGIGLSVAESICARYGGTIRASWKAGVVSFTCQLKSA